ncbi:DNA methyltransferase [uncultured Bacteroides sp.]|uniref:DNA methyltransferase n=1 Tax=uncultured Bacteroides sp. TaxID=162156 RepID=UPI002AA827E4|nr:DNA methyltransferase [uncultured Bacteroides sp.]
MATISYKEIEKKLKVFKEQPVTTENVGYALLKAFGMTDTSIERVRSGKMNLAHYDGILVKKKLAYRAAPTEQLTSVLEEMKADTKIAKASPCIIAVSDGNLMLAYDPREKESYENKLSKLWLDFQFFYPLAGVEKYKGVTENLADVKAAEKMAKLYDEIRCCNEITTDEDVHNLNIFMTRLLFCFFAEDTGIFETNIFTDSIKRFTKDDGSDLSAYLAACFNVMDKDLRVGIPSAIAQFPYVNGGLFRKHIAIPQMGYKARRIILECGELSWSEINPDIFGSMIQAVVSPEKRGELGMHYTSVPNIMKLIGPLFLNDLYDVFNAAKDSEKKLNALLVRLSKIKLFDPACGSGNFLIITYKELRKLEILIWKRIREVTKQAIIPFVNIQLYQFYGIEIDDFCHETAILSLWLAEHQMNSLFRKEFDVRIQALPLRPSGNIVCANACRIDWEDVCPHSREEEVYIMGNPPYLGARLQSEEQKSDMEFAIGNVKGYNNLDYIACWFYNGAKYIKGSDSKYAFVSTNSICQGEQVSILWPIIFDQGLEISFTHTSFKWTNNAKGQAAVIVVILGLQQINKSYKYIYKDSVSCKVSSINAYLTSGSNVIITPRTKPISKIPLMSFGNMANDGGNLFLDKEQKNELTTNYPQSNNLVRRIFGSQEFIRGEERYCLWITEELKELAYSIKPIKDRIDRCAIIRNNSKREATNKLSNVPYLFAEIRHKETNSIFIPKVSSERREYIPIGFLNKDTIISDLAFAIYNAQMWTFGVLTSKMHMAWVKTVGGRLKTDYRYSAQLCYNTFPFPNISDSKKQELESAAEEVLLVRAEHSEKTLAEMYDPNKMPQDLRDTHHTLDLIVESCYRNEPFTSDEERLEHLFKLYEKMTAKK